jgi:enoyl-CoA hydratase/carnithine racemase
VNHDARSRRWCSLAPAVRLCCRHRHLPIRSFETEQDAFDYEARGNAVLATVESVRVPTIAAIAGSCTGAGAAIANCCDIRIGSPSARYGFPIARTLGNLSVDDQLHKGCRSAGYSRLKDLIFRAHLMDAGDMLACGLPGGDNGR